MLPLTRSEVIDLNREVWYYTPEGKLVHHGIKGQKWGERNGPPYPLKSSQKSVAEKVVKTHKPRTATGLEEFVVPAITVAIYVAAIAISVKASAPQTEKDFREQRKKYLEKLKKSRSIDSFADAPQLESKMSPAESMKVTNPEYPRTGYTANCTFCTTAMALREMGYRVKARKSDNYGMMTDDLFEAAFGAKAKITSKSKMIDDLLAQGEGAYGNLSVRSIFGGGHSIFWKNVNGKTRIYDGQNGEEYTETSEKFDDFMQLISNTENVEYQRLDNCSPTEYALALVEESKR